MFRDKAVNFLLVFTLFPTALLFGCNNVCENQPLQTIASPSGGLKVIVFSRNCGATTGFNTQVSILPGNETLANEGGNTFVAGTSLPIVIRWTSDSALEISGIGIASPIKQIPLISNVTITYLK